MTGFTPAVRNVIIGRQSHQCARCCRYLTAPVQIHHRRPRAMGGTSRPESNLAANGLALCVGCHEDVENDRLRARSLGYLVASWQLPSAIPVWHCGTLVRLSDDGSAVPSAERTAS